MIRGIATGSFVLAGFLGLSGMAWANPTPPADCPFPFSSACIPNANEVCIFQDICFKGNYRRLQIGNYPSMNGDATTLPNDSLSSYMVGSGVTFEVFWDANYASYYDAINGPSGAPYVGYSIPPNNQRALNYSFNVWNDNASSMKVLPNCTQVPPFACSLFTEDYYTGLCVTLMGSYGDSSQIGLPDNSIKSVLCHYDSNMTFTNGHAWLFGDNNFGNFLFLASGGNWQLPSGVRGQTSSVFVY